MLDLMLGNSEEAFSCGEIYALFRPFRQHHFDPECTCGRKDCPTWKQLRTCAESELHARALEQSGARYVIDSSKDLRWVLDSIDWAGRTDLTVYSVLIWKDPVDLAHSHWKRGRPVDYFRKQFLDYYERFLALDIPFVSVSYTRLVEEPGAVLEPLCRWLGMDYTRDRAEFWRKQHHHFFGSAGTARQVGEGDSRVSLRRDFPEDFVRAFESLERAGPDHRMERVLARLQAADIANGPGKGAVEADHTRPRRRPAWYYRHALKAAIRRHFPERTAVAD